MARLIRAAVLLAALAPVLSAQEGWEHSLPDNTVVFVGVRSVEDFRADYAESAMGRFLADPEVESAFAAVKRELEELADDADDNLGFDPLELPELISGAAAFAMLDLRDTPTADESIFPMIFAFVADVGEHREEVEAMIDDKLDEAAEDEDVVVTTEDLDGELITTVALGSGESDGDGWVQFGFQDSVFVVAAGQRGTEAAYLDLWDAVAGEAPDVLADTAEFRKAVGSWDGDGAVMYVRIGSILEMARDADPSPFDDPESLDMAETLGFFGIGALAQTLSMGSDGMRIVRSLAWEPDGLLFELLAALFVNRPPTLLDLVPAEVQVAGAVRLDLAAGFDAVLRMVMATGDMEMSDIVAGLAEMDAELGFSLRDDLLANLDGQLALFAAEVGPAERLPMAPDSVNYALIVGLADGAAIRTLVDTAVENSGFRAGLKRDDFQGFDVYKIAVGPGMFVNWAIAEDTAVLSLAPSMVHDVLRRKAAGNLPTVVGEGGLEQALSEHTDDYSVVTYADAASTFNSQIQQVKMVLGQAFAAPFGAPGASSVPEIVQAVLALEPIDQAVIDKYFDVPSVSTFRIGERGMAGVATSP